MPTLMLKNTWLSLLLSVSTVACGGVGQLAQNKVPRSNVAEATGRAQVMVVEGPGRPLIVDWTSEQRADLEVAMRQGVAVVRYNGANLALLPDCAIPGKYRFFGVTQKTEVVRLEDQAEVRANLPLAGASLVSKISGQLAQGSTLDVAMIMVGKSRTAWATPTRSDLAGRCKGATHFVRGAVLGAFAMRMGQRASARTAVEIFGEGVRANAAANAGVQRNDGVLAACAQADPDSDTPPKQCRALIRLELSPIAKQVTDVKRASEHAQESCGKGFVRTRGKCTVLRKKPTAPICTYERMKDCRRLCKSGDGLACFKLAYAYISRDDNSEANLETSFKLVERSCQLKVSHGCLVYGDFLVRKTRLGDAVGAYTGACMMGSAPACELAGGMYLKGTGTARNPKRAAVMNRRGCDGGEHAACVALSGQYAGGIGVAADQKRSFVLNQRACNGDSAMACGNVGFHYEFGVKVNKDLAQSRRLYARACGLDRSTCLRLGILRELGHGQRGQKAKQAFEWSCARPKTGFGALSCGYLNRFYGQSNAVAKDALKGLVGAMIPRCKQGLGRACGFVGMALVVRRSNKAPGVLKRACGLGDQWACRVLKRLGGR